jgi:hypothetical protein
LDNSLATIASSVYWEQAGLPKSTWVSIFTSHGMRNEVMEELVKSRKKCLIRRKEKRKYFQIRRHQNQYGSFKD